MDALREGGRSEWMEGGSGKDRWVDGGIERWRDDWRDWMEGRTDRRR